MSQLNPMIASVPIPARMARLPIDQRGFPVPFFVAWVKDGHPAAPGEGTPDHRIMDTRKFPAAIREKLCWVCGERLGTYYTSAIGPMCAINRTISEPPSHLECCRYSMQTCPFVSRPHARRREDGIPEEHSHGAGYPILRNPGVMLLWTSRTAPRPYRTLGDHGSGKGILFDLGEPESVEAWCERRKATWDEVMESITSGLPHLLKIAMEEGPDAQTALADRLRVTTELLHHHLGI